MSSDNFTVDEMHDDKKTKRNLVLCKLYEISDGDSLVPRQIEELQKATGIGEVELDRTLRFLQNENLVEKKNLAVRITHLGIKEIEQPNTLPNEKTDHSAPTIIQHFKGAVGAVQNAPQSTANIYQNIHSEAAHFDIVIAQLKEEIACLPEAQKSEAVELVDSLAEQIHSQHPKRATVKVIANGLGQFISKTASGVLADYLSKTIGL